MQRQLNLKKPLCLKTPEQARFGSDGLGNEDRSQRSTNAVQRNGHRLKVPQRDQDDVTLVAPNLLSHLS